MKLKSEEHKVIVSGFAKGVDKYALNSAIKYGGKSIVVLPQGVATFGSGFKTYYKQIQEGSVLILSTFYPKADWNKKLAMERNSIIYGLAREIYVAESKCSKNREGEEIKGGTYSSVINGLKMKKRLKIYVRKLNASEEEDNSLLNNELIQKGADSVDCYGNLVLDPTLEDKRDTQQVKANAKIAAKRLEMLKSINTQYHFSQIKLP